MLELGPPFLRLHYHNLPSSDGSQIIDATPSLSRACYGLHVPLKMFMSFIYYTHVNVSS